MFFPKQPLPGRNPELIPKWRAVTMMRPAPLLSRDQCLAQNSLSGARNQDAHHGFCIEGIDTMFIAQRGPNLVFHFNLQIR